MYMKDIKSVCKRGIDVRINLCPLFLFRFVLAIRYFAMCNFATKKESEKKTSKAFFYLFIIIIKRKSLFL